jgi:capsular polysaccharide transport system ATP-binding protein
MTITLSNVHKSYRLHGGGTKQVLSGLSAEFRRGEAVGILGRNGAGKSTLLRVISGVEHPEAGQVERGMSISWPLGHAAAMHYSITGADNARFIARIYEKPMAETLEFVESFAELGPYYRQPVRTYSAGMMSRLGFALSLAVDFDCYLVDETVAAGDSRFAERCRTALLERRARCTMLLVSHQPETVRAFCTAGAVLKNGRLTRYEDLEQAIAAYHDA